MRRIPLRPLIALWLGAARLAGDAAAVLPLPTLDPNFYCEVDSQCGNQGYSVLSFDAGGNDSDIPVRVHLLPDGRLLGVGWADTADANVVAFGRLFADGTPDTLFGTDGRQLDDVAISEVYDSAVDAQGRIWVLYGTQSSSVLGLARYGAGGVRDPAFSGDGMLAVEMDPTAAEGFGKLRLMPDGKALVAAAVRSAPNAWKVGFARITADGNLDSSFDGDGVRVVDLTEIGATPQAWQPRVLSLPGGNTANFATALVSANGQGASRAYEINLGPGLGSNISLGFSGIDPADTPGCIDGNADAGRVSFNDAAPAPGGIAAVGMYYVDGEAPKPLFAFVSPSAPTVLECFDLGSYMQQPLAVAGLGGGMYAVHAYVDAATRRLDLFQLTDGDFIPFQYTPSQPPRQWPANGGGIANVFAGAIDARNGRVVIGAARQWTPSDNDFAFAGYRYSTALFADGLE